MAIHVRSTRGASRQWKLLRKMFFRMSAIVAVAAVLLSALILYLVRIFSPVPPVSEFVAYMESGEKMEEEASSPSSSYDAVRQVNVQVQPVIVTTAPVDVSLAEVDIVLDADLLAEEDFSMETGMTTGDLGTGGGGGDGRDSGTGRGGSGRGKGGGGLGNNDDIQVVLALDASISMQALFQAVAASLDELIGVLRECSINGNKARVNVGVVVYGQAKNNGKPFVLSPFSVETDKIRAQVNGVMCDGSLEHCGEAIQFTLRNFPWNMRNRSQMLKVIFLAGDESFTQGPVRYEKAMEMAKEMGVIVNTIHCGGENMEWKHAASLGGGEGLSFDMNAQGLNPAARQEAERNRAASIAALYRLEVLPIGSPAEQKACMDVYNSRPPLPNPSNLEAMRAWNRQNLATLIRGYSWDAVELSRRLQLNCTLDTLGGRGNMPPQLRTLSDGQIMDRIFNLAQERGGLIAMIRQENSGGFIDKLLETLIRQADKRNIQIIR